LRNGGGPVRTFVWRRAGRRRGGVLTQPPRVTFENNYAAEKTFLRTDGNGFTAHQNIGFDILQSIFFPVGAYGSF
jgi:hypothetical protein